MEILEEKYVETARYGTILMVRTEKGWTYQYDETLVLATDYCDYDCDDDEDDEDDEDDDFLHYLDEDVVPSGVYIPELDCLEDDCFYDTYEKAYEAMLGDMSNNAIMGLIAVYF